MIFASRARSSALPGLLAGAARLINHWCPAAADAAAAAKAPNQQHEDAVQFRPFCRALVGHMIADALRADSPDALRFFLDCGQAPEGDAFGAATTQRLLAAAAEAGAVRCMAELVDARGAGVRAPAVPFGASGCAATAGPVTPLVAATRGGSARAVAWLIERGALEASAAASCGDGGGGGASSPQPQERAAAAFTELLEAASGHGHRECAEVMLLSEQRAALEQRGGDEPLQSLLQGAAAAACRGLHDGGSSRTRGALGCAECLSLLLDHGASAREGDLLMWVAAAPAQGRDEDGRRSEAAMDGLIPRLIAAGAEGVNAWDPWSDSSHRWALGGISALRAAAGAGRVGAARALCANGAMAPWAEAPRAAQADHPRSSRSLSEGGIRELLARAGPGAFAACADELIEHGAAELLACGRWPGDACRAFGRSLRVMAALWREAAARARRARTPHSLAGLIEATAVSEFASFLGIQLARWPLGEPLPPLDKDGGADPQGFVLAAGGVLPAALEHATRRVEVLRAGRADPEQQQQLAAAFLRRVSDACGAAVAPAYAPFARFRFVESGGLRRAHALEREVHRFPVERVALYRAALHVAREADAAAEELCVPLLREVRCGGGGSGEKQHELRLYAAARAAGRWGDIRDAVLAAEEQLSAAEAALEDAVAEAQGQAERLRLLQKAGGSAAAAAAGASTLI